jgi:uncharacterized membrane protein
MFGVFALLAAALFTGAAVYVSIAEQPARLTLDDRAALAEWQASYPPAALMQATLALIGFVLAILEWLVTGNWAWLVGALLLIANWPYTFISIMPLNDTLKEIPAEQAGPASRRSLQRWGRLHALRSALGAASTLLFTWAAI